MTLTQNDFCTNYIDGQWTQGEGEEFESYCPYTNKVIWRGNMASINNVQNATQCARDAFHNWSKIRVDTRITILREFQAVITGQKNELATIISKENGKPLWESHQEVQAVIGKVDLSIQAYNERQATVIQTVSNYKSVIDYKPLGVMGILGPYNFPAHLPLGHIIPALIAGNSIVFKPSEYTPLTASFIVRCLETAGMPVGVVNLVHGNGSVGKQLVNENIEGILFTGSYDVGVEIHKACAGKPWKLLALEMGGNNPLIIGECSDLKAAAKIATISAFISSGQRCTCARRLIITNDVSMDGFIKELQDSVSHMRIGYYLNKPEPFMGPLISQRAVDNIIKQTAILKDQGATTILDGIKFKEHPNLITPTILDVTNIDKLVDQEYFGPLLQVIRVDSLAEAISVANNTKFGLSAGIITDSKDQFDEMYKQVRAGVVNWNMPIVGALGSAPFGGVGKSGNYRPSAYFATDYCSSPTAGMQLTSVSEYTQSYPGLE